MNLNLLKKAINLRSEVNIEECIYNQLQLCFIEKPKILLKEVDISRLETAKYILKSFNLSRKDKDLYVISIEDKIKLLIIDENYVKHYLDCEVKTDIIYAITVENFCLMFSRRYMYVIDLENEVAIDSVDTPTVIKYFDTIVFDSNVNMLAIDENSNLINIKISPDWKLISKLMITDCSIKKAMYIDDKISLLKYGSKSLDYIQIDQLQGILYENGLEFDDYIKDIYHDFENGRLAVLLNDRVVVLEKNLNYSELLASKAVYSSFQTIKIKDNFIILTNTYYSPISLVLELKKSNNNTYKALEVLNEPFNVLLSDLSLKNTFVLHKDKILSYYKLNDGKREIISKPFYPLKFVELRIHAFSTKYIEKVASIKYQNILHTYIFYDNRFILKMKSNSAGVTSLEIAYDYGAMHCKSLLAVKATRVIYKNELTPAIFMSVIDENSNCMILFYNIKTDILIELNKAPKKVEKIFYSLESAFLFLISGSSVIFSKFADNFKTETTITILQEIKFDNVVSDIDCRSNKLLVSDVTNSIHVYSINYTSSLKIDYLYGDYKGRHIIRSGFLDDNYFYGVSKQNKLYIFNTHPRKFQKFSKKRENIVEKSSNIPLCEDALIPQYEILFKSVIIFVKRLTSEDFEIIKNDYDFGPKYNPNDDLTILVITNEGDMSIFVHIEGFWNEVTNNNYNSKNNIIKTNFKINYDNPECLDVSSYKKIIESGGFDQLLKSNITDTLNTSLNTIKELAGNY